MPIRARTAAATPTPTPILAELDKPELDDFSFSSESLASSADEVVEAPVPAATEVPETDSSVAEADSVAEDSAWFSC